MGRKKVVVGSGEDGSGGGRCYDIETSDSEDGGKGRGGQERKK